MKDKAIRESTVILSNVVPSSFNCAIEVSECVENYLLACRKFRRCDVSSKFPTHKRSVYVKEISVRETFSLPVARRWRYSSLLLGVTELGGPLWRNDLMEVCTLLTTSRAIMLDRSGGVSHARWIHVARTRSSSPRRWMLLFWEIETTATVARKMNYNPPPSVNWISSKKWRAIDIMA